MADLTGPFDSKPWSQTEWYRFASMWAHSAIVGTPASSVGTGSFGVTASGLNVTVATGRAWMRGAGFEPEAAEVLATTPNGNASLSRRDRIVIRRDLAAQTEVVDRLTGTASATPAAPTLTQNETGVWEIPVCSFLVPPNNGTSLTGFIDERSWIDSGGRVSVYDANGLAGLAAQPDVGHGFKAYMSSTKRDYRWDGSAWQYAGGAPPAIVLATVFGGWAALAGLAPGCYKDASGLVHIVGGVTNNDPYVPNTALHQLITLPVGYRPAKDTLINIFVDRNPSVVPGQILTNGEVRVVGNDASNIPLGYTHYFPDITFHPGYAGGALS